MSPGNRKFVLQVCKSVSVWKTGSPVPLVCLPSVLTWVPPYIANYRNWMFAQPPLQHLSGQYSQFAEISQFSRVPLSLTPWTAAHQVSLSITSSWSLLPLNGHQVSDVIQPSHPLLSPSPAFSLSQHQGLFQWVSSLHQVAKVLQLQHQFFQWIFRTDFL